MLKVGDRVKINPDFKKSLGGWDCHLVEDLDRVFEVIKISGVIDGKIGTVTLDKEWWRFNFSTTYRNDLPEIDLETTVFVGSERNHTVPVFIIQGKTAQIFSSNTTCPICNSPAEVLFQLHCSNPNCQNG